MCRLIVNCDVFTVPSMDRYEKILKIETYMVAGKVLDPEQRAIVPTKTTLDLSLKHI